MKMKPEHFTILKTAIDSILEKHPELPGQYKRGEFPRAEKTRDLQRRFCFDLFYASGIKIGDGIGTHGDINGDYDDSHIYTALRAIAPKL